jgi:hypothetical protein
MKRITQGLCSFMLILSAGCSTMSGQDAEIQSVQTPLPTADPIQEAIGLGDGIDLSRVEKQKNGKILKLVRIMEGAACKNEWQGVFGMFLLYANPDDVERIKAQRGAGIFAEFENSITDFAMHALENAVEETVFPDYLQVLDSDLENATIQALSQSFQAHLRRPMEKFERKNGLTIDIDVTEESLRLITEDCEMGE